MFIILVFLFGLSFDLSAAENRLICSDCSLFLSDCRLNSGPLTIESSFERTFNVRFDFNCRGHDTNIGLKTDRGFHALKPSAQEQNMSIVGKKLSLVDDDPSKTKISTFDLGCQLKILEITETLSADSRAKLNAYGQEIDRLKDMLVDFREIDVQIVDLMLSIEQVNPENLSWSVKTLKKIARKLSMLVDDPIFSSKETEVLALKEAVLKTKNILKNSLDGRVKAIFDRLDSIVFETMDMAVFSGETQLEEKVKQAKNVFNGGTG